MATQPPFTEIARAWAAIEDAFPDAYSSANAADKPKVLAIRDIAQRAWYEAINRIIHDDDKIAQHLTADLAAENANMQKDQEALRTATGFLKIASAAAKTAAALATLAV